jgi:hypothetical protein
MWSWIRNSNFVPLCCQCTHQGGDWENIWPLVWFLMSNWLALVWIWIQEILVVLPTICFVWGVGDLVQRTGNGPAQVGYSVARRSRGRVMLYAVCTMHKKMRSTIFLVQPQNQGRRFLLVWYQNRWLRLLWFDLKTTGSSFLVWASKLAAVVWWFDPQNPRDGFLVWSSNPSGRWFIGCPTKPMGGWRQCGTHIKI